MKINNLFKLIIAIVVSELAGIIGSVFTTPSIAGWYAGLAKPALNPPAWVFGPVWAALFALMGIAAFLVWKKGLGRKEVKIALGIFIGQLVLNMLWSIIFFGLHSPAGAFIDLIILWFAILAMIMVFARISKPAAWLLVPYIIWISFAGYLNFNIWQLNKNADSGWIPCTQEAKLCPDGSYVGRTGPQCAFAACPGENAATPPEALSSGIRGTVLLGPTCPVERIPPDPACAARPYKTVIRVIKAGSPLSSPFATAATNDQGQFAIMLPAGEYAVQPAGGNPLPRCATENVAVEANTVKKVNLSCDTGIR